MNDDQYIAFGTVHSSVAVPRLAAMLNQSGWPAKVAKSSHYKGGEYVRVEHGESRITAEKVDASTYLLRGEAGERDELRLLCEALSNALKLSQVAHSIELYDENDILKNTYLYEADA